MTSKTYKILTCPAKNCPDTVPYRNEIEEMDKVKVHTVKWGWSFYDEGENCKMVFSASEALNGKLKVTITASDDVDIHVFKMPRHWNKDLYYFKGFFENNDFYTYQETGVYEAPSDWVIYFHYNTNLFDGSIVVQSEVVEYDDADIDKIKREWQPTGTFYVNKTALAEIKK